VVWVVTFVALMAVGRIMARRPARSRLPSCSKVADTVLNLDALP